MLPHALAALVWCALMTLEIRLERWPGGTPKAEYEVRVEPDGNEVRHGPWQSWHENGKAFEEGAFSDGLKSGAWVVRWPNGKRRELGDYAAGLREGAWKHYHESGPKAAEGSYRAGRRAGAWTFWTEAREVDAARSGTYAAVSRTLGAAGMTLAGTELDGRPIDLWVWRRADGSLRLAGCYGPDGPEGPWVAAFADGSLDLDGQCGEYTAGVRTGPLAGWPEGLDELPRDLAHDPRRATPLAVDAESAARFEAWLAADVGAREGPLRALTAEPSTAFAACVAFLQQVDFAAPDERAQRVAEEALPQLIGVRFPLDQGARAALVWRDHVELDDFDGRAWRALFDTRWRRGALELAHTLLTAAATPQGFGAQPAQQPPQAQEGTQPKRFGMRLPRRGSVKAVGGSGTEEAVERGFEWICRTQHANGSWEHGTPRTLEATAWALATLAERGVDVYGTRTEDAASARALTWLLDQQRTDTGRYATPLCTDMRSHALALWAVAEQDTWQRLPALESSLARGLAALLEARLPDGAWPRDVGGSEADVFSTLYAGLALTLLEGLGHDAARAPRAATLEWLAARTGRDGALVEPDGRTPAATAAAAFLRLVAGLDPLRDAVLGRQVGWMVAHPSNIEPRHPQLDAEYLMFGAWTSFQVGGPVWEGWNKTMKIQLLQVQRREGDLAGSWETQGIGTIDVTTVTAQRVLTFQTYYRYAPRRR